MIPINSAVKECLTLVDNKPVVVCPECGKILEVSFPTSFVLNRAEVKCVCNFKMAASAYCNSEALNQLNRELAIYIKIDDIIK